MAPAMVRPASSTLALALMLLPLALLRGPPLGLLVALAPAELLRPVDRVRIDLRDGRLVHVTSEVATAPPVT
eukprot:9002737-Alexandrium_andersonii.AAC.1